MTINRKKGFTLIELLVVIAIIGILSSVVLASLNTARNKGNDAKVKAQLASLRASAEVYYDNQTPNSYGITASTCTTGMFADAVVSPYLSATNLPSGATPTCQATATAYAVSITLPGVGGTNSWCVDSTGKSQSRTTPITTTSC
jgi:prepilin-type N-terminal cleavage/methylation domain-containing protein